MRIGTCNHELKRYEIAVKYKEGKDKIHAIICINCLKFYVNKLKCKIIYIDKLNDRI